MTLALTQQEAISAIAALSQVIIANKGLLLGDEDVIEAANQKIKKLIPMISETVIGDSETSFLKT